jgi:hypothetical protein
MKKTKRMANDQCPFSVGDTVVYRPSAEGYGRSVMIGASGRPQIGQAVRITSIIDGGYIEWDGLNHPAGGIYWTEFSPD